MTGRGVGAGATGIPGLSGDWTGGLTGPDLQEQVRRLLTGRRVDTSVGDLRVGFTIADATVPLTGRSLTLGQLDDVTVEVADLVLDWGEALRFEQAAATLRNVHLRNESPAVIVGAPVDLSGTLPLDGLIGLLRAHRPDVIVEFLRGRPVVRWAKRPTWGYAEVDVDVAGTTILVSPRAVVVRKRRLERVRRIPPLSIRLPLPTDMLSLTSATIADDAVRLTARLDQVRVPLGLKGFAKRLTG